MAALSSFDPAAWVAKVEANGGRVLAVPAVRPGSKGFALYMEEGILPDLLVELNGNVQQVVGFLLLRA